MCVQVCVKIYTLCVSNPSPPPFFLVSHLPSLLSFLLSCPILPSPPLRRPHFQGVGSLALRWPGRQGGAGGRAAGGEAGPAASSVRSAAPAACRLQRWGRPRVRHLLRDPGRTQGLLWGPIPAWPPSVTLGKSLDLCVPQLPPL